MKPTWTKVYVGPGYPEDPERAFPILDELAKFIISDIDYLKTQYPRHDAIQTPFGSLNVFTDPRFEDDRIRFVVDTENGPLLVENIDERDFPFAFWTGLGHR